MVENGCITPPHGAPDIKYLESNEQEREAYWLNPQGLYMPH